MITNGWSGLGGHRVRAAVVGLVLPLVACTSAAAADGGGGGPSCWKAWERIEYLFSLGRPVKVAREVLEEILFGEGPGSQGGQGGGNGGDKDDGAGGKTDAKKKKSKKKKVSGKATAKDEAGKDDTKEGDTKAL